MTETYIDVVSIDEPNTEQALEEDEDHDKDEPGQHEAAVSEIDPSHHQDGSPDQQKQVDDKDPAVNLHCCNNWWIFRLLR